MSDQVLTKKLHLKIGKSVLVLNPPPGYLERISDASPDTKPDGSYDFIQLFVTNSQELHNGWPQVGSALTEDGLLWICYPKLSSGIKSDLNRDAGWEIVFNSGYRPVTQIAIDETWSALRFKPAPHETSKEVVEAQFSGARASLRPVYDRILEVVLSFGADIQINPRQSYIALARKQQFAVIKASTSTRLDLGLRLKTSTYTARLEPAQGLGSGSINYKIRLTSPDQVDAEVVNWLKAAYESAR